MENNQSEIKAKIAEIRERFNRLLSICGPRGINRETLAEYERAIKNLQAQLN